MNNFYTLSEVVQEENRWEGRIRFNEGHAVFNGHFPGQPVVPGVCMMQIVKEVMESVVGKKMLLQRAPQVKFLQLIVPDVSPVIYIEWSLVDDVFTVNARFKTDKDLFKMNARMIA